MIAEQRTTLAEVNYLKLDSINNLLEKYPNVNNIFTNEDSIYENAVEEEWKWCLVGNIVQKREYGENHEIKYGTKHFSPGTKIYCAQGCWGDGYENIIVIVKILKIHTATKKESPLILRLIIALVSCLIRSVPQRLMELVYTQLIVGSSPAPAITDHSEMSGFLF